MNIFNFYKDNENNCYTYFDSKFINKFISKVYLWMSFGLFLTFITSLFIYNFKNLLYFIYFNKNIILLLFFLQFFIVLLISNLIYFMNKTIIISLFIFYSILTGINFSILFFIYSCIDIFISFLSTSFTFLFMTLYGHFTKDNLLNLKNLLVMLVFGILISSIINLFFNIEILSLIISYINIFIFTYLIAYDSQKLKKIGKELYFIDKNLLNKYYLLGALILYLDFINLFLIPLKYLNKKNKKY